MAFRPGTSRNAAFEGVRIERVYPTWSRRVGCPPELRTRSPSRFCSIADMRLMALFQCDKGHSASPFFSSCGENMQVLVFVSDDGRSPHGVGPTLILEDRATAVLPPHPRSLNWRYFATMRAEDAMFGSETSRMRDTLRRGRPFVTSRLVR